MNLTFSIGDIVHHNKKITEFDEEICRDYAESQNKISTTEILQKYNISEGVLRKIIVEYKLPQRQIRGAIHGKQKIDRNVKAVCSVCGKRCYNKEYKFCGYCGGNLYAPDYLIISWLNHALKSECSEDDRKKAINAAIDRIKKSSI